MTDVAALLNNQKLFNDYLKLRRYSLSCYHFSSIFLWKDFFSFEFKVMDNALFVLAKHALGNFLYLPPLGRGLNSEIIQKCFGILNEMDPRRSFSRIENVQEDDIKLFDPKKYRVVEKSKEYCYLREEIAGLRGNKFKSKRSSRNYFIKNYKHRVIPFDRTWSEECKNLFNEWAQNRKKGSNDEIYLAMLQENQQVHELIFQYYNELGLIGRLVLVDEKPQAYTFGYPLNDDTFCVLVEITNLDIKGLSVFTFNLFCNDQQLKAFKFINVMDDFAMENIAKAKGSFHPQVLYPSYAAMERE